MGRCRQAHRNIARYHRRPDRGGIDGNADAGTTLTLDVSLPGIDASGVMLEPATGGADIETQESFRARMLLAYQKPPQGKRHGLRAVGAGGTRCYPLLGKTASYGAGTVGVYIMCDGNDETNHGFPVGSDGISQLDDWEHRKPRVIRGVWPTTFTRARQSLLWYTFVRQWPRPWILRSAAFRTLAEILLRPLQRLSIMYF